MFFWNSLAFLSCFFDDPADVGNWISGSSAFSKTSLKFGSSLYQIPYDYTVEVRNRFKGLDLIDRVPEEIWTEVRDIVQETGIKTIPKKKKYKKEKWLSEEALQIALKRRVAKSEEKKIYPFECRVPKNSKEK